MKDRPLVFCFLPVFAMLVVLCGSVKGGLFDSEPTVRKARCYANCLTLMVNEGSPDIGCHSDRCKQCGSACEMVSASLDQCKSACNLSSICEKSCYKIADIKKLTNIYNGDGSTIPKPPVANATTNLTSITLSWQPGVKTANGSVVYLLKKKFTHDTVSGNDKLEIVFTEPIAVLPVKEVCRNVVNPSRLKLEKPITFYLTVVALTEHSALVEGDVSEAIAMPKPDPVFNISHPVFTFHPKLSNSDALFATASVTPSPAQSQVMTKYGVQWRVVNHCQGLTPKEMAQDAVNPQITLRLYNKLKKCPHSLKVYSMVECIASLPKTLLYTYPGCYDVPTFDKTLCYSFDPPPTPNSLKHVQNLSHTQPNTEHDYRFTVNVTWLPPKYPYLNASSYAVDYGNASKTNSWTLKWMPESYKNAKSTFYRLTDLHPKTKYRVRIKPYFPVSSVVGVYQYLTFDTLELPTKHLIIQNVQVALLGFSDPLLYSYNVTWAKNTFTYGTFVNYLIYIKKGNFTAHRITTTNTYFVIQKIQHLQPFVLEITPNYTEAWIKGSAYRKHIVAPGPPEDDLKVSKLFVRETLHNTTTNTYSVVISWGPPRFMHKPLYRYRVSYSLSGYPQHSMDCLAGGRAANCQPATTKDTSYQIPEVLPREHTVFEVTPSFLDSAYVGGISSTFQINAPFPKRVIVQVRNLTYYEELYVNDTAKTTFSWQSPLFRHSAVAHYNLKYSIKNIDDQSTTKVSRRSVLQNQTQTTVTATRFVAPALNFGQKIIFEVTPAFVVDIIVGEKASITISKPSETAVIPKPWLSTAEISVIVISALLLLLIIVMLIVVFFRRKKLLKNGLHVGANGALIDHWEVPIDKIYLEEELGEGAFGKVFKGMLLELPGQSAKYSIAKSIRRKSLKPLSQDDGYVVAVKMLHDMADPDQRREFLKEIQLMKDVGSHRNIVNMLGCGTLTEPMFLIVEYLPNGDLLHYLRKRRGNVKQYSDNDPRGPYHSTYCQTYFNKNNLELQACDRVYVHEPEPQNESKNGEIQLISINTNAEKNKNQPNAVHKMSIENSENNSEMENQEKEEKDEEVLEEDVLTPGDLMAFAWQVSQGMEYLSQRGYVHRDLAARNVLVGNKKEAKIADFGLTRHMYENLYQAKTNRKLPLKWMSIEAIFDQRFTSQSDVWAYGVFLWELVTLGGTPYPSINNKELLKLLKEGYRMDKPETCDSELYEIMCTCWKEKAEDRPTFVELREKLEELMTRDNPYFDPSAVDESRDYYNVPSFNSAPEPDEDDDIIDVIIGEATSQSEQTSTNEDENKNTLNDNRLCLSNEFYRAEESNDDCMAFENLNFQEPEVQLNEVALTDDSDQPTVDRKPLKYAKLDFDDIEFQLYRRQNQGLVL